MNAQAIEEQKKQVVEYKDPEAERFLNDLKTTNINLFLSGAGGNGKTFLIKETREYLQEERICFAMTATTGIAAQNIDGCTLHSWAGIGLATESAEILVRTLIARRSCQNSAYQRIRDVQVLVVDEISMLSTDIFQKLDVIARRIRGYEGIQDDYENVDENEIIATKATKAIKATKATKTQNKRKSSQPSQFRNKKRIVYNSNLYKPFGGIRMIVVGDFMQLQAVDPENRISSLRKEEFFLKIELRKLLLQQSNLNNTTITLLIDYWSHPHLDSPEIKAMYMFHSKSWLDAKFTTRALTYSYRQQNDPSFQIHLNNARFGIVSKQDQEFWCSCDKTLEFDPESQTWTKNASFDGNMTYVDEHGFVIPTLYAYKRDVYDDNLNKLDEFKPPGEDDRKHLYSMRAGVVYNGRFYAESSTKIIAKHKTQLEKIINNLQCPSQLYLKIGAPVILLINLPSKGLFNGSRGIVMALEPNTILVKFENEITERISRHQSKKCLDLEEINLPEVQWTKYTQVDQFPLVLAYSMTIHKMQGQTLTTALISLKGTNHNPGQAYVAVSRVKSGDKLFLMDYERSTFDRSGSFLADYEAVHFYKRLQARN